ncbi:DUF4230 domain-containing protein [Allosphingosinicella vermicomposti]|uniref:DUF4230 domain-containing protein n=1 Tax=Allosphingosinicella vermicomposti TaxID=614671 RepID=UPI000D0F4BD8|nr:DUF4230 domain-containing protein [Allosphingosinicella vermicomposti]
MKRPFILVAVLAAGLILGAALMGAMKLPGLFGRGPDPETIATASLQSVREQARLTPFVARYVAVVTSTQSRFGLDAQKTMILPGTVRYEVDLAKLQRDDLDWDAATNTLNVTLPPVEIAGPEIDLNQVQEYSGGGVLMSLTNAEAALDAANRQRGTQSLLEQARAQTPMRLARNAARTAVERSFAMPLRAAGIEAKVVARFAGEAGTRDPSQLDRSRRIEDVLEESKAKT